MPVLATVQLGGFFICIAAGFVLGLLYDFFSALRFDFPSLKLAASLLDAIFWIIFAVIFFTVLQIFCDGEFYWFFLAGAVLGFVLYLFTLSKILLRTFRKIICIAAAALKRILRVLCKIFSSCLRFFLPIYCFLRKIVQFTLKRIINFVKKTVEIIRRFGVLLKKV